MSRPKPTRKRPKKAPAPPAPEIPIALTEQAEALPPGRLESWPLSRLKAAPRNSRLHSDDQLQRLVESIRQFGFVVPVIAKPDGELIAGHARTEAARRAGLSTVPVVVVTHLTAEEARLYTIADNRLAELATWDTEMLALEIAELREHGLDVTTSGFSDGELDELLRRLEGGGSIQHDERAAAATMAEPREVVTRLGDIWTLGDHRIACGDSRSSSTWSALCAGDEPAACVHTDPPYGVAYRAGDGQRVRNDDLTGDALSDLIARAFKEAIGRARADAAWYVWHAGGQLRRDFEFGMEAAGLVELQTIVWAKPTPNLGRAHYQWAHEPCFYAARQGERPQWHGGRDQGTCWRIGIADEISTAVVLGSGVVLHSGTGAEISIKPVAEADRRRRRIRVERKRTVLIAQGQAETDLWECARDRVTEHATPKPVELVTKALSNSTVAGEIVLDPFAGAGATLMGCERAGRRCRAIELEPGHVDTIVRRWEATTGRHAMLCGPGAHTFAETASARAVQ